MEASAKVEGSLRDVMPLLKEVWHWTAEHYLVVMAFVLALAIVMAWRKRR